jgi:phosphatidylserine/phosphatidylglycerophosphate/cardiolipin synthase-like enzyme
MKRRKVLLPGIILIIMLFGLGIALNVQGTVQIYAFDQNPAGSDTGNEWVTLYNYDYMHNKFIVVDNRTMWTGSMNPTPNGLYYNNNNVIVINSTELACNYATELLEMWNGQFGKSSPADTPYPIVYVNGTEIECYFAPEDGVEDQIVDELNKGHSSVYFATFSFTSQPIAQALIDLHKKGADVKGIYEKRQNSTYCTYQMLRNALIAVIWDKNPETMHHKFFVIDNITTITGSFNPSKHANTANDENLLIIHNKIISNVYINEFYEMWDER